MKKSLFLLFFLLVLPACTLWRESLDKEVVGRSSPLVHLIESTYIIRNLIAQNKLETILEKHDPEKLELLLDNVSPAKMAFETEVFSSTVQPVVVYYFEDNQQSKDFIKQLGLLASGYDNRIKFVTVDADKLFSLADDAEIDTLPTVLIIKDREIVESLEGGIGVELLERLLNEYAKAKEIEKK